MTSARLHIQVAKACALAAAALVLPVLVYSGHDNDNKGGNPEKHWRGDNDKHHWRGDNDEHHGDPRISAVPEANTGMVLIPFVGAILLFSSVQLFRAKAARLNRSLS